MPRKKQQLPTYGGPIVIGLAVLCVILSSGKPPAPTPAPTAVALASAPAVVAREAERSPPAAIAPKPVALYAPPEVARSPAVWPVLARAYVKGQRVAIRSAPDGKAAIVDRVDNGLEIEQLERRDGWIRVRHPVTAKEGWIAAERLSTSRPDENNGEKERDRKLETASKVAISVAAITAILLRESQAEYHSHSPCACPSDRDRGGRACGKRSAWSRPGGYSPLCFASDVTPAMVAAYRSRSGTQEAAR